MIFDSIYNKISSKVRSNLPNLSLHREPDPSFHYNFHYFDYFSESFSESKWQNHLFISSTTEHVGCRRPEMTVKIEILIYQPCFSFFFLETRGKVRKKSTGAQFTHFQQTTSKINCMAFISNIWCKTSLTKEEALSDSLFVVLILLLGSPQ